MCFMVKVSLYIIPIVIVSVNYCIAKKIDELNLCDRSAEITVRHAFVYQNAFILHFDHKFQSYVSKSEGYELKVSRKVFELEISKVDLWEDWYIDVNGTKHEELKRANALTSVYNIRDEYIVYVTKQHYYKVEYNPELTRIVSIRRTNINDKSDPLQVEITTIFNQIRKHPKHNQQLTALRFPRDQILPKRVFLYEHLKNDSFEQSWLHILRYENKWVIDDESGSKLGLAPDYKVVSAFHLTGYRPIFGKNDTKYFYIVEISADGRYKVRGINVYFEHRNNSRVESKVAYNNTSPGLYNGDIKQYIDCNVPKPQANTRDDNDHSEITSPEPAMIASTPESEPKSKTLLYIILAIVLLLIILAIILCIWCLCCKNKDKSDDEEGKDDKEGDEPSKEDEPKTTPEDESPKSADNTMRSNESESPQKKPEDDENIDEEALEKRRKNPEEYDETAMYSIDGVKRKMQE